MKTIVTYLDPHVARLFKVVAAQEDRTLQDISEEALMDWLRLHNKKNVVELKPNAAQQAAEAAIASYYERVRTGKKTG